jgi:hypothetical protein
VAKNKKKYRFLIGFLIVIVYIFAAARPIPMETVLTPRWLSSLESNYPVYIEGENAVNRINGGDSPEPGEEEPTFVESRSAESKFVESGFAEPLLPFTLGNRFGYIGGDGTFALNRVVRGNVSAAKNYWAEYGAAPESIEIMDPRNEVLAKLSGPRGYPFFIDDYIFLIHEDQNSLTFLDSEGNRLWTYDFSAPITDIDAAAGLILAGTLDGTVELLTLAGKRFFFFEPGGSRYSAVYGCRISQDGSKLAIISGFDDQRFLLLEKLGDSYKVAYHEFLSDGFRRPVHISFIAEDRWVAFEGEEGLVLYNIGARNSVKIPLEGDITALDNLGTDNLLFVITSQSERKKQLVGIRLPDNIIMKAPFSSGNVFLGRQGQRLYIGGGSTIASFDLAKR